MVNIVNVGPVLYNGIHFQDDAVLPAAVVAASLFIQCCNRMPICG